MSDLRHVKGLAELQRALDQLPAKLEANVLRGALRAGANVVLAEAKARVPVDTGLLRDGLKVSTRSRRGVVMAKVKATGKHAYKAVWVEFGTAAHKISAKKKGGSLSLGGLFVRGVQHPGARARPFLRPALDGRAQEATVAVGNAIKKRLAKRGIDTSNIEVSAE